MSIVYVYIKEWNVYIFPERNYLAYVTTDRKSYQEYRAKNDRFTNCPWCEECLSDRAKAKAYDEIFGKITRNVNICANNKSMLFWYRQKECNRRAGYTFRNT